MKKCEDEEKIVEQILKDENEKNQATRKGLTEYSDLLNNRLILENQTDSYYIALFQLLNSLIHEGF